MPPGIDCENVWIAKQLISLSVSTSTSVSRNLLDEFFFITYDEYTMSIYLYIFLFDFPIKSLSQDQNNYPLLTYISPLIVDQ